MKTKLLMLVAIVFACTGFGYASTDDPMKNYYGADLTQFPPDVRDWIVNRAFTKEKMEKPFMVDSKLRVWWSSDNNAVQTEATYTVAEGYKGAGTVEKWGNVEYSGGSDIFNTYGEYAKYHTLRFKWELQKRAYELLETDPAFAEIIRFAKLLCDEIEYDWDNFSSYAGKPVRRTPNKKYYVCEGYANEVMDRALELECVRSVQKWSSTGHAWNVLRLKDGRTLYFDLTWFDNEYINPETGEIYQTDDYDWENITFDEELFRFSNVGYGSGVFHHDVGELVLELEK